MTHDKVEIFEVFDPITNREIIAIIALAESKHRTLEGMNLTRWDINMLITD